MPQTLSNAYLNELKEFASFSGREQRFIRLCLEIASNPQSYDGLFIRWSRNAKNAQSILSRLEKYDRIEEIKLRVPLFFEASHIESLFGQLTELTNFDLQEGYLESFGAYRYLYERLFGADVRPWLPGAYCAAATMPNIPGDRRRTLLQSISEAAATAPGWSKQEPVFFPEWIEKEAL